MLELKAAIDEQRGAQATPTRHNTQPHPQQPTAQHRIQTKRPMRHVPTGVSAPPLHRKLAVSHIAGVYRYPTKRWEHQTERSFGRTGPGRTVMRHRSGRGVAGGRLPWQGATGLSQASTTTTHSHTHAHAHTVRRRERILKHRHRGRGRKRAGAEENMAPESCHTRFRTCP